ncbi:MAG TPA: hypothetical protein VG126_04155 [Thermoleophilaceae bacterium]|nr:hypothetical protein [Thermoleophilaceae bacterium]
MSNSSKKLTLIVADEVLAADHPESKPEDFEEQGLPGFVKRVRAPKDVDLAPFQERLRSVQGQIDELLAAVTPSAVAGFRLNAVQIGLAISAEGSIGVATAGVEASMSLSFERVEVAE